MKMTPESHGQIEPLCKFGPGGDFVALLQPERIEPCQLLNPLMRILSAVGEVIAVFLGLRHNDASIRPGGAPALNELADCYKEKIVHADTNSKACHTTDPAPASASDDGGAIPGESMLFPDLRRNGVRIEPKPKHRLRAHHRAAKKRSALRFAEQGTLFDVEFASAKIA